MNGHSNKRSPYFDIFRSWQSLMTRNGYKNPLTSLLPQPLGKYTSGELRMFQHFYKILVLSTFLFVSACYVFCATSLSSALYPHKKSTGHLGDFKVNVVDFEALTSWCKDCFEHILNYSIFEFYFFVSAGVSSLTTRKNRHQSRLDLTQHT